VGYDGAVLFELIGETLDEVALKGERNWILAQADAVAATSGKD
jgi:hypothetical protein